MPKQHSAAANEKIRHILNCALTLLRDKGDHGLTMRQVAQTAGMSLSNLQYYFKTKNDLLKGMVDYYFQKCEQQFSSAMAVTKKDDLRQWIHKLITISLVHEDSLSEICRIFREFWAIATRNDAINKHLDAYYHRYAEGLTREFESLPMAPEAIPKAVSILIPYFEGYSITSASVPLDPDQVADLLTDIITTICDDGLRR